MTDDPITRALDESAIRVKPLEWDDFGDWGAKAKAFRDCRYMVRYWSRGYRIEISYPGYSAGSPDGVYYATIKQAKAAAQVMHDAAVRDLVEVVK